MATVPWTHKQRDAFEEDVQAVLFIDGRHFTDGALPLMEKKVWVDGLSIAGQYGVVVKGAWVSGSRGEDIRILEVAVAVSADALLMCLEIRFAGSLVVLSAPKNEKSALLASGFKTVQGTWLVVRPKGKVTAEEVSSIRRTLDDLFKPASRVSSLQGASVRSAGLPWFCEVKPNSVLLVECERKAPRSASVVPLKAIKGFASIIHGDFRTQRPFLVTCTCKQKPCKVMAAKASDETSLKCFVPSTWGKCRKPYDAFLSLYKKCQYDTRMVRVREYLEACDDNIEKARKMLKVSRCIRCGREGKIMLCGRCKKGRYCTKECQIDDYNRHRRECKAKAA